MASFTDMRSPPLEGLDSHSDKFQVGGGGRSGASCCHTCQQPLPTRYPSASARRQNCMLHPLLPSNISIHSLFPLLRLLGRQLDEFNRARASGGKGIGKLLSFGRSPKPAAASPGTPENLQLDELLLFSEDSLPTSLLKHTADNQTRAVKMFASVLQYMGVHGDMLGAMAALELVQKLLHQGLKRPELRDELFMQLVKQTRGNPNPSARTKAWQLLYMTAATMPPTKDFMGLISGESRMVCSSNSAYHYLIARTFPTALKIRVCAPGGARRQRGGGGACAGRQDLARHEAHGQGRPAPHAARHARAGRAAQGQQADDGEEWAAVAAGQQACESRFCGHLPWLPLLPPLQFFSCNLLDSPANPPPLFLTFRLYISLMRPLRSFPMMQAPR